VLAAAGDLVPGPSPHKAREPAGEQKPSITGAGSVLPTFRCDKGFLNVPIAPANRLAIRSRSDIGNVISVSLPGSGSKASRMSFTPRGQFSPELQGQLSLEINTHATFAANSTAFLLAHGTDDDIVDREQTEQFLKALKQSRFYVRRVVVQSAPYFWMGDPIEEAGSFSGFLVPRVLRFLADRL
jgi:hypothetical protein